MWSLSPRPRISISLNVRMHVVTYLWAVAVLKESGKEKVRNCSHTISLSYYIAAKTELDSKLICFRYRCVTFLHCTFVSHAG